MKVVHDGQWVSVANGLNKRFPTGLQPCAICRRLTCARVWFSIYTHEVRCRGCFTPVDIKDKS